jgi:hypothetical protein
MDGVIGYIVSVVVIPAALAAFVGGLALATPLRRRAWVVDAGIAIALPIAFVASFVSELGSVALLRKFMVVEGDDAPFERWHWLGIACAALIALGFATTFARSQVARGGERFVDLASLLVAAVAAGIFVQFPQPSIASQIGIAGLVLAAGSAVALAGGALLWISWGAFGILAALAGIGGFASLAVMAGAVSVASFVLAILAAIGGKSIKDAKPVESAGAPLVVVASMLALVARCGDAYDQSKTPDWIWWLVPLVPGFALLFMRQSLRAPSIAAATFWRTLGAALVGVAVLGAAIAMDASKASGSDDEDDPYADMYGG